MIVTSDAASDLSASMNTVLNTHTGLPTPVASGTSTPHNELDTDFIAAYGLPPSYADSTPTTPTGGEEPRTTSFFPLSPIPSNAPLPPLRARRTLPGDDEDTETLPGYEPPSLPAYEPSLPLLSYACHQTNRKLRTWMLATPTTSDGAPIDAPTYLVTARSAPSLFSKKPDFTLSRLLSPEARRRSSSGSASETSPAGAAVVAALRFVRHSELPWHPRVAVEHVRNPLRPTSYVLRAPHFRDFVFDVPGGTVLEWSLVFAPTVGLALVEKGGRCDGRVWARFEYSCMGTNASKGQEVGRLHVYELRLRADGEAAGEEILDEVDMFELIMGSCEVVVQYWKSMGKQYSNRSRDALLAIEREQMLTYADWGSTSFVRRSVID